jgi:hypothetical protein
VVVSVSAPLTRFCYSNERRARDKKRAMPHVFGKGKGMGTGVLIFIVFEIGIIDPFTYFQFCGWEWSCVVMEITKKLKISKILRILKTSA